jgi:PucR-like helix-turn-helix protein
VKDLEVRLAALDPDAGAAIRVIGYFDRLAEAGATLEAIVRGAAVLAGCPARLIDEERRLSVRVQPDGTRGHAAAGAPDQSWPSAGVAPGRAAVLWLERPGPAGPVDAIVLERAAAAARGVLAPPGRAPLRPGAADAAVATLIDPAAGPDDRRHAARLLGLASAPRVRAVATAGDGRVEPSVRAEPPGRDSLADDGRRRGIGTAASLDDLPSSWASARIALRFTADGTSDDPGARCVRYDELGALALLAGSVTPATPPIPDELALQHAAMAAPWMLATLDGVVTAASLRAAATALVMHHSTLQERIEHAERLLGWPIRNPAGRQRLALALSLRRLRRPLPGA